MVSRRIGVSYPSHKIWYRSLMTVLRVLALPPSKIRHRIKTRPYKGRMETPNIFMYNHVSDYDFYSTVDIYRPYSRYVISDAMLRSRLNALIYPLLTDFIYRRKGENADDTVRSVMATIEDGVSVGLSPEGGESPNGTTESIRPRTGKMVKDCGCGMVTIKLYGGYFIRPTWARFRAKGPMFGEVVGVYDRERISGMAPEDINELIAKDIHVNHYEWIKEKRIVYERKHRAEWMEKTLNVCPRCKRLDAMKSEIDDLYCKECGYRVTVDEFGLFRGKDAIFDNMYDWDMWQRGHLTSLRPRWLEDPDKVITSDSHARFDILRNNMPERLDSDVKVEMTAREMRIIGEDASMIMPLEEITGIAASIANGFGVSFKDEYYQVRGTTPMCNNKYRFIRKVVLGQIEGDPLDRAL